MTEKRRIPVKEGLFRQPESGEKPYLIGSKCGGCGYLAFPKTIICPSCMKENTMQEVPLSRRGKLDAFVILRQAPSGFTAPYIIGYVILPEGVKIYTMIAGTEIREDALKKGQEMEMIIDRLRDDDQGNEIIGWKFKPV